MSDKKVDISELLREIRNEIGLIQVRLDENAHKLSEIEQHNYIVGHIVEQIRDRNKFKIPRFGAPIDRLVQHKMFLTSILESARQSKETCYTAKRSLSGRWHRRLDLSKWIRDTVRLSKQSAYGLLLPSYSINQRNLTIPGSRPRILHAIANVFVGGSTQLVVDLFDHLGHAYDMHVLTSAIPPGPHHEGMIIHHIPGHSGKEAVKDLLSKFVPDIVHVHYWGDVDLPWYESVYEAASEFGCKIIQNINTPVRPYNRQKINKHIFVSNNIKNLYGSASESELVIYPGIDLDKFTHIENISTDAEHSIGMVYRLERDKLNERSIEPIILAVKERRKIRAFVIGGGSLLEHYKARVHAEGLSQNFVFTGYVPYSELNKYYQQFSIFVAPVWKESFGQVTPFAMAMGMAVAGNLVGALPEILQSEETLGINPEDTAQKIIDLIDNPIRRREIGLNNRRIAVENFGIETMIMHYDDVYREVLLGSGDQMPGYPQAEIFS